MTAIALMEEPFTAPGRGAVLLAVRKGLFLISGGPSLFKCICGLERAQRICKGTLYGLSAGVFIASFLVVGGYTIKVALMSLILVEFIDNFVRSGLFLPAGSRDTGQLSRQGKYANVHWCSQHCLPLQIASWNYVAPARMKLPMLFAALMGGRFLSEDDRLFRLTGTAGITLGYRL